MDKILKMFMTHTSLTEKQSKCLETRLEDASEVRKLVRSGEIGPASHIRVHRPRALHFLCWKFDYSYDHHFLVTDATENKLTIVHYAPKRISMIILLKGVAEIIQESVEVTDSDETLDFSSGVYHITSDYYPKTQEEKSEAVKRAKRRLGERQYSVFHNNCDSFVSWTLLGKSYSHQAMNAKGLLFCIGICARCCIRIYGTLELFKNAIKRLSYVFGE
ncbi:uncharacterized protein LOC133196730 [Saccostrea echinata]|uniref:uncharacterized protein LOC133196730 n=1 Tax=Saccostrea echinata TaxID=191078 RepID=UPI002A83FB56|nr:uncharacterized protein LOC133196730 [Saccostrea echinata]